MAWQRGGSGSASDTRTAQTRTYLSGTALFSSADGRLLAHAEATWVAIDLETFGRLGAAREPGTDQPGTDQPGVDQPAGGTA